MAVKLTGMEEIQKTLAEIAAKINAGDESDVMVAAQIVRGAAIKSIQKRSGGIKYSKLAQGGENRYTHQASKAGDAPNTDTGDLVSNIGVKTFSGLTGFGFEIESKSGHSEALEFGTKRGLAPRPFLRPAIANSEKQILKHFSRQINRAIKKSKKGKK